MKPEPRVEGCIESLPGISLDVDAHFAQLRFWDKVALGRPFTDAAIERYRPRGWYARGQFKRRPQGR
jgi:hypothetical protein